MRRIVLAFVTTVSALVMLFSYHTSTMGGGVPTTAVGTGSSTQTQSQTAPDTTTSGSAGGSGSGSGGDGTYTGDSVDTRWGPVQVQITVSGGKVTRAVAVVFPSGNRRDQEINGYALPVLAQEAVTAQSAQIDHVSGATVTSDGYVASLQSAIDQAHL
ncbi:MAG: hypothetical protein QOE19_2735 [Actinomycetota bacterium]|jgi:uncharacterized protein with FMN-binding domain|nr:hypothetical protein [Actinomycetota bacterium]